MSSFPSPYMAGEVIPLLQTAGRGTVREAELLVGAAGRAFPQEKSRLREHGQGDMSETEQEGKNLPEK